MVHQWKVIFHTLLLLSSHLGQKAFLQKNIDKYLLLNDYKNNNINIFNLYLKTYTSKRSININENEYFFTLSNCSGIDNIPILKYGHVTPEYITLRNICHH